VRRPVIVFACVALAVGLWLTAVLSATRENSRLDVLGIYALLGADGEPESCPDVTQPPSADTIEGARQLAQMVRLNPRDELPNPNPAFGATLPAEGALTATAGSLSTCVGGAETHHPGWDRVLRSLR